LRRWWDHLSAASRSLCPGHDLRSAGSEAKRPVIRDAMRREGVIGLARVVLSSRERYFLVEPCATVFAA
jgi:non-homologous end joining protein Ku